MNVAWTFEPPLLGQDSPRRALLRRKGATRAPLLAATAALACFAGGCGTSAPASTSALPADERPIPVGPGPAYRIPAVGAAVAHRAKVGALACRTRHGSVFGVHLELYARRLVVPVPAGIGVAPPQRKQGAYVLGGACTYALRTFEPTGVVVLDAGRLHSLTELFEIWGQPLSKRRLARFSGPMLAFVDGRRWRGAPGAIPLRSHAELVLEIGGYVIPHPRYRFAPGL